MKKFASALAAATLSASALVGAGIASAEPADGSATCADGTHYEMVNGEWTCVSDEAPAPEPDTPDDYPYVPENPPALECQDGTHYEMIDGKWTCVNDEAPAPEPDTDDDVVVPPTDDSSDTAKCPDGSDRDMSKRDPVTGAFGYCGPSEEEGDTDEPGTDNDSDDDTVVPSDPSDTAKCPDGSDRDMSKRDPITGGFGYCPPSDEKPDTDKPDTDKPDTDKPDTEKPDTDKPDTEKPDAEKPDKDDSDKGDKDKGDKDKGDKSDSKSESKATASASAHASASSSSSSKSGSSKQAQSGSKQRLAVTGVEATTIGATALALLVTGFAATRYSRRKSDD